jgi:hypothetical protein
MPSKFPPKPGAPPIKPFPPPTVGAHHDELLKQIRSGKWEAQ